MVKLKIEPKVVPKLLLAAARKKTVVLGARLLTCACVLMLLLPEPMLTEGVLCPIPFCTLLKLVSNSNQV